MAIFYLLVLLASISTGQFGPFPALFNHSLPGHHANGRLHAFSIYFYSAPTRQSIGKSITNKAKQTSLKHSPSTSENQGVQLSACNKQLLQTINSMS